MARSSQISALHREQLADIAEFDRAEGWRGDGAVSMINWVTAQCGVSTSTARQWVRAALNLESLPCLAEGLASGALSLDLVDPLAEVASPESDAALRDASTHWSVQQARQLATWHKAGAEAQVEAKTHAEAKAQAEGGAEAGAGLESLPSSEDGGAESLDGPAVVGSAAREFGHRTLRFNDTRRSVWVAFTKDDYAVAKSVLVGRVTARERRQEGETASESSPSSDLLGYVPYDKRLYDALIDLFQTGSGPGSQAGRPVGKATRPRVVVHAPLDVLVGCPADGVAEIAGVGPVPGEVVRRLACDANVDLAVEDRNGSILDQGRVQRDPTSVQRVEIDRRDKGCRFPGCSYTEFTNVHHIQHWADGGLTNLDNLVTLCGRHHRAVHELGWAVSGNADTVLTFTSPHRRTTHSVPSPTWRKSSVVRSGQQVRQSSPTTNGPMRR